MDFYVSSTGSDSNNGTSVATAWLTLGHAQTAVRTHLSGQSADITVHIVDQLAVTTALSLTSSDSGQNGFKVVWQGGSLEMGTKVTGWSLFSTGIYRASYSGANMRSIWVNGERCYRSRAKGALVGGFTYQSGGYTKASGSDAFNTEPNIGNVELVYKVFDFSHARNCVTGVSGTSITMLQNGHTLMNDSLGTPLPNDIENLQSYFLSNAKQGTFYYDQANGFIYYIPRPAENMATAEVIASNSLATAITATGVSNVTIDSIKIQHSQWDIRTDGYISISNGFYWPHTVVDSDVNGSSGASNDSFNKLTVPPSVIYASGCTNFNITNNILQHIDSNAIQVTLSSLNCTVIGNYLFDMNGGGIEIGDPQEGALGTCSSGILVQNNVITNVAVNFLGAVGILANFMTLSDISNNYVASCSYFGIGFGFGLNFHASWQTMLGANTIKNNYVVNCEQVMLDAGAIYMQAPTGGLEISGNYVGGTNAGYQQQSSVTGVSAGIYCDSGFSNVNIFNNIIENTGNCFYFDPPSIGSNTCGVNYTDAISGAPLVIDQVSSYTAPTVQTSPSASNPSIMAAAGPQGKYAKLLTYNPVNFDALIANMHPVAWYKHNDTGTMSADSSGNGYTLTRSGSYSVSQTNILPGVKRSSLGFDGSSAIESSAVTTPFDLGDQPFSIVMLIAPNVARSGAFSAYSLAGNANSGASGTPGFAFNIFNGSVLYPPNGSVLNLSVSNNATSNANSCGYIGTTDLKNNTGYCVAFTYDGLKKLDGLNGWVNGRLDIKSSVFSNTLTGSALSGFNLTVGAGSFQGNMGDVIIFNYELTQSQLLKITQSASKVFPMGTLGFLK